ncbi:NlpC/P60 family protein [Photobacterium galatheae]|nr:NlpC/P60 family protein [Photobacterium galatheae]MCM0149891.1 C40 family peptidase [Photobacterium galatheae]
MVKIKWALFFCFRQKWLKVFPLAAVLILAGCSSKPETNDEPVEKTLATQTSSQIPSSIAIQPPPPSFMTVYQSWKGTPYRLGGTTRSGIDCSAFVQLTYSEVYKRMLPRTTSEQSRIGKPVPLSLAKKGDLIFFRTGRTLRHVGIYMGNNAFLHASTSQGVVVSSLDIPYWRRAFWQVRRLQ